MCRQTMHGISLKMNTLQIIKNLADGFKNDNPLAGSDNYEVYMKTVDDKGQDLTARSKSLAATQQELVDFAQRSGRSSEGK